MDDLKRFAKNDEEQTGILSTVRTFTYDTKMDCSLHLINVQRLYSEEEDWLQQLTLELDLNTAIQLGLEVEESYKHLGLNEGDGIQHSMTKKKNPERILLKSQASLKE